MITRIIEKIREKGKQDQDDSIQIIYLKDASKQDRKILQDCSRRKV